MRVVPVITAFAFGLLFGVGLVISGMTDPDRVRGFLDVAGQWNPSLALVMGGAIILAAPGFYFARLRKQAVLGDAIVIPDGRLIDKRLVGGAAIFGIGWGLSGICPGPSLVLLGYGAHGAIIFVVALIAGSHLADLGQKSRTPEVETDS
jgi:uncharacterized membrane protein YedE/YeeE